MAKEKSQPSTGSEGTAKKAATSVSMTPKQRPKKKKEPPRIIEKVNVRILLACAAILFIVIWAGHAISLWGDFAGGDYHQLLLINKTKDWQSFWIFAITDIFTNTLSQPLLQLTLLADMHSSGLTPAFYHCINIAWHFAAVTAFGALIFRICWYFKQTEISKDNAYFIAFAAAALAGVHPLASEAVSHITARGALMVTFAYFLSLNAFLVGFWGTKLSSALGGYLAGYLLLILGLGCGPQAITISTALVILILLFRPKYTSARDWNNNYLIEIVTPALVSLVVPFVLRLGKLPTGNAADVPLLSYAAYTATQFKALATYYVRCFFVPIGLSVDPPFTIASSWADPLAWLGAALLCGSVYCAWRFRNDPAMAFGFWLFVLGLFPENLLLQQETVSDRRFYLPLFGLCIVVATLLAKLYNTQPKNAKIALGLILAALIGLANWRDHGWRNDISVWSGAKRVSRDDARVRSRLSYALTSHGKQSQGHVEAERAIKSDPSQALAYYALGITELNEKRYTEAKKLFEKSLELQEAQKLSADVFWQVQGALAECYMYLEDMPNAKKMSEKALAMEPNNAMLHLVHGKALLAEHKLYETRKGLLELSQGYQLDPLRADFLEPLVEAALESEAEQYMDIAYMHATRAKMIPTSNRADLLYARACLETGRFATAAQYLDKYMSLAPDDPEAAMVASGIAKKMNAPDLEKAWKARALELDPKIESRVHLLLKRDKLVARAELVKGVISKRKQSKDSKVQLKDVKGIIPSIDVKVQDEEEEMP